MVMETDPSGNFLTHGYEFMSGRDWARLGNLYLNDGVTPGGERILPEHYNDFVSTLAPAWVADENPVYGGFFWINGDGSVPLPKAAYSMQGAGGQSGWIDPSHDLVVVRLGNFKGERHAEQGARDPHDGCAGAIRGHGPWQLADRNFKPPFQAKLICVTGYMVSRSLSSTALALRIGQPGGPAGSLRHARRQRGRVRIRSRTQGRIR
jgi:CubicO group peptidase (beta-lactamase class C family)